MYKKIMYFISIILLLVIMLYFYTFLHEGGHALVAMICGGKIDKFVLGVNAHVRISGAKYTIFSEGLLNASGVLLPVIIISIALAVYKSAIKNTFYHLFYGYLWAGITSSLLAWVAIPMISLFTLPPVDDDATKFLNNTGIHPVIVSLVALLIIALLVFIAYRKGLLRKFKEVIYILSKGTKINEVKFLRVKLLIGIVLGVIAVVVGIIVFVPKSGFETSLSMEVNGITQDVKVPFELKQSKSYSMTLELKAKGILTDIQIYNENGVQVYQNICEWFSLNSSLNLEKGNYVLVLTFLQNAIDMNEHMKAMGYKFEAGVLEHLEGMYNINNQDEIYPIEFSVTIS